MERQAMTDETLLNEKDAAAATGISLRHWQNLKKAGRGPSIVQLGHRHKVRREALVAWWSAMETPAKKTG
jgi:hypothetical protein